MSDQPKDYEGISIPEITVENTESDSKTKLFMKCPLKYSYSKNGEESGGDATVELYTESLVVLPRTGEVSTLSLREITNVLIKDYQIILNLVFGDTLTLYHVGYNYENLARQLNLLYSEVLLKDLLFQETMKQPAYKGEFRLEQENGGLIAGGTCMIRLYETALVLMPEFDRPIRFPYSDIIEFQDANYVVSIRTDFGERISLMKLGTQFSPFVRDLGIAIHELTQKTQTVFHNIWPEFDPSIIRAIAQRMPEGKAAPCVGIKSIHLDLWSKFEASIVSSGIGKEYAFLKSLSETDRIFIGLKRGLMGDLTGTYLWFLVPLFGLNSMDLGNAIAMEAVTMNAEVAEETPDSGSQGKATYFFRMIDRGEYQKPNSRDRLKTASDELSRKICRCLQAVNFRREPIYLPEDSLKTPRYLKYLYAMQSIPGLQELRNLYIGRVIHRNEEQWQNDVTELLRFNTRTTDNSIKWTKS